MSELFDRAVLTAYVLGDLPPDQSAVVEEAARADPNLASRLEFLTQLLGGNPPVPKSLPVRWSRRSVLRRAAAIAGLVTVSGGAAYAGYRLLAPKPIIADDFDDGWIDNRIWETRLCNPRVKEENGYLRMTNRGSLVTVRQFKEPISIQFDWMWIDRSEHPLYPDILKVVLRTAGQHHAEHPFEVLDGVKVEFNPHAGKVWILIDEWRKDNPLPIVKHLAESEGEPLPIASGAWHTVRITDDGKRIAAYISGGKIKGRKSSEPVVEVETEAAGAERRIAIYNRELVGPSGGVEHESRIDNFSVRALG